MDSSKNKKQAHGPLSSTQVCELERCFIVRKYITGHEWQQLMSKLHLTETQLTNWFNNKRRQLNQARLSPKSCKKLKDCTALSGSPLPRDFKPQKFPVSTVPPPPPPPPPPARLKSRTHLHSAAGLIYV